MVSQTPTASRRRPHVHALPRFGTGRDKPAARWHSAPTLWPPPAHGCRRRRRATQGHGRGVLALSITVRLRSRLRPAKLIRPWHHLLSVPKSLSTTPWRPIERRGRHRQSRCYGSTGLRQQHRRRAPTPDRVASICYNVSTASGPLCSPSKALHFVITEPAAVLHKQKKKSPVNKRSLCVVLL